MSLTRYGLTGPMAAYAGFVPKESNAASADIIVTVRADVGTLAVGADVRTVIATADPGTVQP